MKIISYGIVGLIIVTVSVLAFRASPWPVGTTLRHVAAAPNCTAARSVGLAPAHRGEPGYWAKHDRDRDGIACEPWPRQTRQLR
ncbi:excalibur calcium-binding domain-containing protein [Aurantimonas sp. DM33-3]|uniref:excalibur calcium-binding domain-containing protein n=1 Tax=Aurantimonas sp. DM33-3 TaxID=2766955 RepID=UPI0016523B0B|nr:excalibur calcium-binding domain-containing protein [Aurantimonas sp. DM33-3]MBC6715675.1 excalibur calcium-binding domain-containing protein [Aurantimonas sp. DM33-3]